MVVVVLMLKPSNNFIVFGQREDLNQNSKFLLKIDRIKLMQSSNIILQNPSNSSHRIPGFQMFTPFPKMNTV
jgi:hypothetical protein